MNTFRLSRIATAAAVMALTLSACVPAQQYNALENDYNQLNQQLSGEIASQQVHITRLQGLRRRHSSSPKWPRFWRRSSRPRSS
jgi:hypothetical protein